MEAKIAEERIKRLFELAEKRWRSGEKELANRYIEIAREIGMRQQVSIPSDLQKRFCSGCSSYLKPGENCQVRINSKKGAVNYHCRECGNVDRYGF